MIDIRSLPPYFTQDSRDRGIFKPASDREATRAQLLALLSDAKFYTDKLGPDQCPAGLKVSARAVVNWFAARGISS